MQRDRAEHGKIPEINLIPMLNVMMGILAFFVMIAASLSFEKGVDISLTGGDDPAQQATNEVLPDPLIVDLKPPDQILVNGKAANRDQVLADIKTYLQANPKGAALLRADRAIEYETVINLLGDMQVVGGDRVSLALEDAGGGAANQPATGQAATQPDVSTTQQAAPTTQPDAANDPSTSLPPQQTPTDETPVEIPSPGVEIEDRGEDYDS
ncbi:MAG TPA: biopolymer transporter ExbD [Leptolyngbyaceae cyanobacterium M33_DOE_097]|uniref:Biopolymer transporter ExbD n=1 Tax=Oscillatoriales cyanobacterium SpSt-418 TaxID=2282169 RepID=A0A7C3KJP4_9CYAN|nr:biopolymer transporter ExbD [Leptolyngbyaceae cyanobacterium M33_DOE_097]